MAQNKTQTILKTSDLMPSERPQNKLKQEKQCGEHRLHTQDRQSSLFMTSGPKYSSPLFSISVTIEGLVSFTEGYRQLYSCVSTSSSPLESKLSIRTQKCSLPVSTWANMFKSFQWPTPKSNCTFTAACTFQTLCQRTSERHLPYTVQSKRNVNIGEIHHVQYGN